MKGETGRRWSVALGRSKEGRKEVARADMCSDHSVLKLAFSGKATLQKSMIHPFCIVYCAFVYMLKPVPYTPYIQGWLSVTAAERAPPGREGGQLAW